MAHVQELLTLGSVWLLQAVAVTTAVQLRESPIISFLRETSDPDVIPILDSSDGPLQVFIDLNLMRIVDVDRGRNEIEVLIWQSADWTNPALVWNVSIEGFNQTEVSLPSKYLWLPDIAIYNAISSPEVLTPSVAYVPNIGLYGNSPRMRVRVGCQLQDIDFSSGATCRLKLGSWTHSRKTVTLLDFGEGVGLFQYAPTPNYEIVSTLSTTHNMTNPCCPGDEFEVVDYQFVIRARDQAGSGSV